MAATNKRQLNSKDLRLLGVSLPELTHIPLAAATTAPLPLPPAYSPRTPRETSALLGDEEAAACDAIAEPWQDTCKPALANGTDAEGGGVLHVHMCGYCGNASTKEPCEREWKEHWCYVLQGARSLAADIERFEDELNKLTARKRMIQKMFTKQFGKELPETIPRGLVPQWWGYIADTIRREISAEILATNTGTDTQLELQSQLKQDRLLQTETLKKNGMPAVKGKWAFPGLFSSSTRIRAQARQAT